MPGVKMFAISEQVDETPSIKTVRLDGVMDADPGQFVMVWVPGKDEFPMSLSYMGDNFGITYQIIGDGTKALAEMRPGELIGVRGPYGRGYSMLGRKYLIVGGGAGMASIVTFVEWACRRRSSVDLVIGARTGTELLFEKRCAAAGARAHITTDDGSKGEKGLATDLAEKLLSKSKYETIYACGPEKMLAKMTMMAEQHRTPFFAALERLMKCGIGICDSCAIDGKHVCRDGPVFSLDELRGFKDLGKTKLDSAGRRVQV